MVLTEFRVNVIVVVLLTLHTELLFYSAAVHTPNYDEVGHLPAGVVVWDRNEFDLYRVNPPLVKAVAALPAVVAGYSAEELRYSRDPLQRPEWGVGRAWISSLGESAMSLWNYGRWACIPFSLLGGLICFLWSREHFGDRGGLLSLTLWCFSPTVLANGATILPDIGATTFGLLAAYLFSHWMQKPTERSALMAGGAMGLAELTKTTWIILFGLWPILWILHRLWQRRQSVRDVRIVRPPAWQLGLILVIALNILNSGYMGRGSFTPLGEYTFQSGSLTGREVPRGGDEGATVPVIGNRFAGTWLGKIPVPLPHDYVIGLDVQKYDFERGKWSYLLGEHKLGGWWYYYFVALGVKEPLGYWLVGVLVCWFLWKGGWRSVPEVDRLVLTLVPMAVLILVSSQTGFSRYLRYLLPVFPFAFIWMGQAARVWDIPGFGVGKLVLCGALVWGIGSSLWVFPHSQSYFNEITGGPDGGDRYLADANLSWGHDGYYLRDWIRSHPEAEPLTYAYISFFDLKVLGIDEAHTPAFYPDRHYSAAEALKAGPQPGWHIVDIAYLRSHRHHYDYFHQFTPVDTIARSMRVYHLTFEQANQARVELGLPLLQQSTSVGNSQQDGR